LASATMRIADDRGGQIGRNLKISSRPYSRDWASRSRGGGGV